MQSSILVVDDPAAPQKGAALANWRGKSLKKSPLHVRLSVQLTVLL